MSVDCFQIAKYILKYLFIDSYNAAPITWVTINCYINCNYQCLAGFELRTLGSAVTHSTIWAISHWLFCCYLNSFSYFVKKRFLHFCRIFSCIYCHIFYWTTFLFVCRYLCQNKMSREFQSQTLLVHLSAPTYFHILILYLVKDSSRNKFFFLKKALIKIHW